MTETIAVDNDGYVVAAESFREGSFLFSDSQTRRMPLIPALEAFWSVCFPFVNLVVLLQLWNVLLDLCTLSCIYLFVRKVFDERSAFAAGLLYTVYPLAVYRLPLMNAEVISGTALAFWVLGMLVFIRTPRIPIALLLSFLTALILYINPAFQFFPLLIFVGLFFLFPPKKIWLPAIAFLLPALLLVLLWGVRNQAVLGKFYLFDSRGGKEFWIGNHQESQGRWEGELRELWETKHDQFMAEITAQGGNRHDANQYFYKIAMEEILSNPAGAAALWVKKFFRFWFVSASETQLDKTIPLQSLYLALACVGFYVGRSRFLDLCIPFLLILYFCGIYTFSYACIRFSHPIMPWICALGGVGLIALQERLYGGRHE